jgi:hypothetical protein
MAGSARVAPVAYASWISKSGDGLLSRKLWKRRFLTLLTGPDRLEYFERSTDEFDSTTSRSATGYLEGFGRRFCVS